MLLKICELMSVADISMSIHLNGLIYRKVVAKSRKNVLITNRYMKQEESREHHYFVAIFGVNHR